MKFYIYIFFALSISFLAHSQQGPQVYKGATLVNLDPRLSRADEDRINATMSAFYSATGEEISVLTVLTYANNPDGFQHEIDRWKADKDSPKLLIIMNSLDYDQSRDQYGIFLKGSDFFSRNDIMSVLNSTGAMIMQGKAYYDYSENRNVNEAYVGKERIHMAIEKCLAGLVAIKKNGGIARSPIPASLANVDGLFQFVTPSGELIFLPPHASGATFFQRINDDSEKAIVTGTLAGFYIGNEHYTASIVGNNFNGYFAADKQYVQPDFYNTGITVILGFACSDGLKYRAFEAEQSIISGSLEFYADDPKEIRTEGNFPLTPYSETNRLVREETVTGSSGTFTSINSSDQEILNDQCKSGHLLPLLKLVELRTYYGDLFRKFSPFLEYYVRYSNWEQVHSAIRYVYGDPNAPLPYWENKLMNTPGLRRLIEVNKNAFLAAMIEEFFNYTLNPDNSLNDKEAADFLRTLSFQTTTAKTALENLKRFTDEHYTGLTAEQRILLINVLMKIESPDNIRLNTQEQATVVKLLSVYPSVQANDILAGLARNSIIHPDRPLINLLVSDMVDIGGTNAYTNMIQAVIGLTSQSSVYRQKASAIVSSTKDNYVAYHRPSFAAEMSQRFDELLLSVSDYTLGLPVVETVNEVGITTHGTSGAGSNSKIVVSSQWIQGSLVKDGIPIPDKEFDVFDPVVFVNNADLLRLNDVSPGIKVVPAIVVKYAYDRGFSETVENTINVSLDAASLLLGPVGLVGEANSIRRAFIVYDMVVSAANIATVATHTNNDPAVAKILFALNMLNMAVNLEQAVSGASKLADYARVRSAVRSAESFNMLQGMILVRSINAAPETAVKLTREQRVLARFYLKHTKIAAKAASDESALVEIRNAERALEGFELTLKLVNVAGLDITRGFFKWMSGLEAQSKIIVKSVSDRIYIFFKIDATTEVRLGEIVTALNGEKTFHANALPAELHSFKGSDIQSVSDGEVSFNQGNIRHRDQDAAIACANGQCGVVPGGCFAKGTLIHTQQGLMPIENLREGDKVYAYDEVTGKNGFQEIRSVFTKGFHKFVKIFTSRDTIFATNNHPFFADNKWKIAKDLVKGSRILLLSGLLTTVDSVAAIDSVATVYNFEVANDHNYYVGREGLLVHNASGGLCNILREPEFQSLTLDQEAIRKIAVLNEPDQRAILQFLNRHPQALPFVSKYPSHILVIVELWPAFLNNPNKLDVLLSKLPAGQAAEFLEDVKKIPQQTERLAQKPELIEDYLLGTRLKKAQGSFPDLDGHTFNRFIIEVDPGFIRHHFDDYYLKYDPVTGRGLLVKSSTDEVLDFVLDDEKYFASGGKIHDRVIKNLRTIYALPGGEKTITIWGRKINLDPDLTNVFLARETPNQAGEIGLKEFRDQLTIPKSRTVAPRKGGVLIFNVPFKNISTDELWLNHNAPFINTIAHYDAKVWMLTTPIQSKFLVDGKALTFYGKEVTTLAETRAMDLFFDTSDNFYKLVKKGTSPFPVIDLEILTRKIPPDKLKRLLDDFHQVYPEKKVDMFSFLRGVTVDNTDELIKLVAQGDNLSVATNIVTKDLFLQVASDAIAVVSKTASAEEKIASITTGGLSIHKWLIASPTNGPPVAGYYVVRNASKEAGFVTEEFGGRFKRLTDEQKKTIVADFEKHSQEHIRDFVKTDYYLDNWKWMYQTPLRTNVKYLKYAEKFSSSWDFEYNAGITKLLDKDKKVLGELYDNMVKARAGTEADGDWNALLNLYNHLPNHVYSIDDYITYHTDHVGRVKKIVVEKLQSKARGRNETQQRKCKRIKNGFTGIDDGGHGVPQNLWGPSEQIAYWPMEHVTNSDGGKGQWRLMEKRIEGQVAQNKDVRFEVEAQFLSDDNHRPSGFIVNTRVNGTVDLSDHPIANPTSKPVTP